MKEKSMKKWTSFLLEMGLAGEKALIVVCNTLRSSIFKSNVFVVTVLFTLGSAHSAEVVLKDKRIISGEVIQEKKDSIKVRLKDGTEKEINRSGIAMVDYMGVTKPRKEYPAVGMSVGWPAAVNLVGGYYWEDIGFKIAGMKWGIAFGTQLNLSKRLVDDKDFSSNLSAVAAHLEAFDSSTLDCVGAGIEVNFIGFDLELDPAFRLDTSSVILLWNFGFIQRFN